MRGTQFAGLSAFVAVAEEASFRKAAKRLGLSNATLSHTVRSLEEQIGVRLLNRTTRSVAPTEAGERLLGQLRPLLDGFDAALESINAFRDKPTGHLRLTAPAPVAKFVLGRCWLASWRNIPKSQLIAVSATLAARFALRALPQADTAGPQIGAAPPISQATCLRLTFGSITALVNNAGIFLMRSFTDASHL